MAIQVGTYVPILKWRMGEYQALYRLQSKSKNSITPIFLIPPIEYDFEERCMKRTVQEHIEPFSGRYSAKWGGRSAFIDFHDSLESAAMDSGELVVTQVFNDLREVGCTAAPVVSLSKPTAYINQCKLILGVDNHGIALRVKLEELMAANASDSINKLIGDVGSKPSDAHLVVDVGLAESFEPYESFATALLYSIGKLSNVNNFASVTLAGTSLRLKDVAVPGGLVPRHEWLAYKAVVKKCEKENLRTPSYSDYVFEPPGFVELDMRFVKPPGKIVYTAGDKWFITKGKAFRGNEKQMIGHCKSVIQSGYFSGPDYCYGDKRIQETASGKANTGNLTTWKQVGVSHHLTMVASQLSNLHG